MIHTISVTCFIVYMLHHSLAELPQQGSMQANCEAVLSGKYVRLKEIIERHNYGYFDRKELCDKMATVIKNDKSSFDLHYSARHAALSLMLCHIDRNASDFVIDVLIDNIHYRDSIGRSTMMSADQYYPALACLLKIGRKATDKILMKIATSSDTSNHSLFARWFFMQYDDKYSRMVIDDFLTERTKLLSEQQRQRVTEFSDACFRKVTREQFQYNIKPK